MSRKKATSLTIKSLTAFSKVRSSTNSLISDKGHGLVRNLSIAAERSDFQNPNCSNGENLIDCQQNPRGFYSKTRNNVELKHSSDGYCEQSMYRGNTGENHQNPNEFNRGDTVVGFKEDPGVAFEHYSERKNVNLPSGDCRADSRNEFQGNPNGQFGYLSSSGKSSENVWQNMNPFYGGHTSAHNSHGSHGQGQYGAQQHMDNRSYGSAPRFTGHANEQYGGNIGQFQGRVTERYSGNAGVFQHNPDNYPARNTGISQQSSDKFNSGSGITPQHYPGNYNASKGGGYGQNQSWGDHHLADTGASQQVPQKNYLGNVGMTQHHPDNYGQGSTTTYQQGMGTPYVGSPNGYVMQNVEEGRHNASSGHYPNNSNESQGGITNFPLSNNVKSVVESVESAECYSGTIEELDDLCKEEKMKEVVELLELLEKKQIPVPLPRCLMLMKACGEAKALKEAKFVHEYFMRSFTAPEVSSYNIILEMYGKCGTMDDAVEVFDKMPKRNLTSWDTMITCFAKNGLGEDAIELFSQFKQAGLKPDGQMFIGVLSACSVLGDINEGMLHFESMSKDYSIIPSMEHYVSVVDMLGSAGYLDEAIEFIEKMPVEPSVEVWESLMNLSRVYGHVELGDRCAELVQLIDPTRLHDESKAGLIPVKASDIAKEKEKKKLAAENLLAVRSRVHEYRAGDTSHPEKDKIYALLRGMKEQMREAGYVAETRFVLHDIDQESKEDALLAHSERLAVAYGLMSSPARAPMRIIKNLRVCGDCHSALKIISKLVGRELIIRDAKRFHHFKDGLCSCRDYW